MNPALAQPLSLSLLAFVGQAMFVGVYLLLLAGIVFMPKTLFGATLDPIPWWRNLRFWAAAVCVVQILVYGLLG